MRNSLSKSTVDDILRERDDISDTSIDYSFTLEDIIKEDDEEEDDQDNLDDLIDETMSEEEITETKPSKKSDTMKSLSAFEHNRVAVSEPRRISRLKDTALLAETMHQNMTFATLITVSAAFDTNNKKAKGIGQPTCLYSTSGKYLAVGTSLENVILFEVGVKDYRILHPENIKGQKPYGNPNSICISDDNRWLVTAFDSGSVALWEAATGSLIKTVNSLVQGSPSIVKIQFWKGNSDFLTIDTQGNVILHTIEKYLWTGVRSRKLFQNVSSVYYDVKTQLLQNSHIVIALSSQSHVFCLRLEPAAEPIVKLPTPPDIVPLIDFGKIKNSQQQYDILVISCNRTITIYKYNSLARAQRVFEQQRQFQWPQTIISVHMLCLNTLTIIDVKNNFTVLNLLFQPLSPNSIKHKQIYDQTILFQKFNIGKQQVKSYSNCISRCNGQFKQLFILTMSGVTRGRLHRWTDFIRQLIQMKKWNQVLRASIDIFQGNLDIFAQKVSVTPSTVFLFNELLNVYLKTKLDDLLDSNSESVAQQIAQSIDMVIQFCLDLRLYEHLFGKIYDTLSEQYKLKEEFMDSLSNFINYDLIKIIPQTHTLNEIISFYAEHKPELVDRLISNLEPGSIHYASTIQVCSKYKLYNSLMYISQLTGDFIAPLNKILLECRHLADDGYQSDRLEELLQLLFGAIEKTIRGETVAGVPLSTELSHLGIKKIAVWMLTVQNAAFLIKQKPERYFECLSSLLLLPLTKQLQHEITVTVDFMPYLFDTLSKATDNHEQFTKFLMSIPNWDLTKDMLDYCVAHLPNHTNILKQFILKYYDRVSNKIAVDKLPPDIQAIIFVKQNKIHSAIRMMSSVEDRQQVILLLTDQQIKDNLEQLLPYDVGKNIFSRLTSQEIDETISCLPPSLSKYKIIRQLMILDRNNNIPWRESTMLYYLESLCRYRKEKRVLHQLQHRDWNYTGALPLIQRYRLLWCQAYIQEVLCQTLQAFRLYCQMYRKQFLADYQKILKFQYVNGKNLEKIYESSVRMLRSLPLDDGKYHLQLFECIFEVLKGEGKKKKNLMLLRELDDILKRRGGIHTDFSQVFNSIVGKTIEICAEALPVQQVKILLDLNINLFNGTLMVERVRLALQQMSREFLTYGLTERMMEKEIGKKFAKMMKIKTEGRSSFSVCSICRKPLQSESCLLYELCGCCFHQKCNPNCEECPTCKMELERKTLGQLQKMLKPPSLKSPMKDMRKSSLRETTTYVYGLMAWDRQMSREQNERDSFILDEMEIISP